MSTLPNATPPTGPSASPAGYCIRPAEPRDAGTLVDLIRELAAFEQLSHAVETTEAALAHHLFGPQPVAECLVAQPCGPKDGVAEAGVAPVAFALFFTNFSTFRCRPGLYLEDLYVQPAHRRHGLGRALLCQLAALAQARGCGRFEWTVLDWNANAIALYQAMGAQVMPEWRICRVAGEDLARFGQPAVR